MLKIILILISLTGLKAVASERVLVCGSDANQQQHLEIRTEPQQLEPTGQVTKGPYSTVNLICNNAVSLIELKKDILCAGVERSSSHPKVKVITEAIVSTPTGYKWRGYNCL